MSFLTNLANSRGKTAGKFRSNRFNIFVKFLAPFEGNRKIRILDVGGLIFFWEQIGFINRKDVEITILNLEEVILKQKKGYSNIFYFSGDGCDMSNYKDKQFDIVFSNSVIEHVGGAEKQKRMAEEIQRVGKSFFLQTPSYWFPLEPHFLTFGFQFLPIKIRAFLLRRFNLGWYTKIKDYQGSIKTAESIRLLTRNDLEIFFPGAEIISENFLFFTKSYIVYKTNP